MRIVHAGESDWMGNRMRRGAASMWLLLLLLPIVGLFMGFLGGALTAYVVPRQFESRAMVQVTPATGANAVLARGGAVTEVSTEQFFATELEVIMARATLERVVEKLDLPARWGMAPDACVARLKEIVQVGQVRGTDLIEVRVRHPSAEDAKLVAEQVVIQYRDRRNSAEIARAQESLDALDQELRRQEGTVEEKRKVLDTIVQAVGVPAFDAKDGDAHEKAMAGIHRATERNLQELERERESLEIQVGKMDELVHEELLAYAAGLQHPQNGVATLYEEYRRESTALSDLLDDGMGDGHPKVVAQRVRVDVLRRDLNRSVAVMREILQTQLDLVESRLDKMQQVLAERRSASTDEAPDAHDYLAAVRDYEEAQALQQRMKLEHSSRRIEASIPRNPITIHEMPKAGRSPVTPNVTLHLAGGSLGGAALGVVLAIVIGLVGRVTGRSSR